jgi:hypothetical protein
MEFHFDEDALKFAREQGQAHCGDEPWGIQIVETGCCFPELIIEPRAIASMEQDKFLNKMYDADFRDHGFPIYVDRTMTDYPEIIRIGVAMKGDRLKWVR